MGQQVLAVAGQVIGSYFGPVGAAIGGAIGGYIGGVLFNEDQVFEGPRLSDLRIQTSNYGNAVPIIYGTYRCAGNVIWSTDIRETRLETDVGGKGGPDTIQVEYQYDLDVAVAVGEPPLGLEFEGLERIYANGVLIYDTSSTASAKNVFASGQWATGIFLYPGNETQLPDPTMEAALGVGNVPAYRGTGYVVITGLQLNVLKISVLPNFEFVVSTSATVQLGRQLAQVSGLRPIYGSPGALFAPRSIVTSLSTTVRVANNGDLLTRIYDLDGVLLGTEPRNVVESTFPDFPAFLPRDVWPTFEAEFVPKEVVAETGLFGGTASLTIGSYELISATLLAEIGSPSPVVLYAVVACADKRHYMLLTGPLTSNIDEWFLLEWDGETEAILESRGTIDTTGEVIGTANAWGVSPVATILGNFYCSILETDLKHAWQVLGQSVFVWEIDANNVMRKIISFTSGSLPLRDMGASGGNILSSIYANDGLAAITNGNYGGTDSYFFLYSRLPQVDPDGIPLVDILTDLCERTNLPASELTFTGISDFVDGFAVGQTMTARAAMEVLRPAYYFDAIDSDTFKFVKRGAASIVDIAYVDLGAGTDAPTIHAVQTQRAQETEIPARINVKYLSTAADYQVAAQSARRETTGSREIAEINLPIVFDDDDEVAGIADILLRERWAGAFTRSYATTIEYAKYEPTDVVRLDDGLAVRTVRVRARVDKGSLIEWEAVDEDVEAYDSNAVSASVSVPSQDLAVQGQSAFAVLDIPPLTETAEGNESAAYVAAKGYLPNWPGTGIDVSRNEGTTYQPGTSITQASVMGVALTALSDFLGGNVWDEASTVQVDVGAGTLSSATRDEVLDGANLIVIGDEVLQYRTATLVSAGVYNLIGFLRGRKGTEWAISTHAIADAFVLLSSKLRDLPLQISDRALDNMLVRATTGSMLSSTGLVRSFSPRISRLMPYSPVHLSATRDASGNWLTTWVRRDRYMQDWNDLVDVPLSETVEAYDVEVMDGSTLLATYVDVAGTEQEVLVAVLGGIEASITFRVYQKSSIVGRGFVAEATITQA